MAWTPCEVKNEFPDEQGRYYTCPYSDEPTSEMCRNCEYDYAEREEEYEE